MMHVIDADDYWEVYSERATQMEIFSLESKMERAILCIEDIRIAVETEQSTSEILELIDDILDSLKR